VASLLSSPDRRPGSGSLGRARLAAAESVTLISSEQYQISSKDSSCSAFNDGSATYRERELTVVGVTHGLTEALKPADRIVEPTHDRRLRELDVNDHWVLARQWLAATIRGLGV